MVDPAGIPAQSGTPAQIQLKSATRLASVTSGRILRVFVEDVAAGGSVVLRVGGKRLQAMSPVALRKGEWYLVRVVRSQGEIRLQVEQQIARPVQTAEIARTAGLPGDELSQSVIRAFLRSGLALFTDRLARAYRRFQPFRKEDPRRLRELIRLDALLSGKGVDAEGDMLETILPAWEGPGDREAYQGSSGGERENTEPRSLSAEKLEKSVRGSFRMSDSADHPLQLFNHIVGEGDHWVIIPINIADSALRATLRLRISRARALHPGDAGVEPGNGVLVVHDGERRWSFSLQLDGKTPRVVVPKASPPLGGLKLDGLRSTLLALGYDLEEAESGEGQDDGFSDGRSDDIMTSVDSNA